MHRTAWTDSTDRGRTGLLGTAALVVALLGLAGLASAHTDTDEHGTLTLHDEQDGEPVAANGTAELACEVWVHGSNVTHANGTILASHADDGGEHTHEVAEWEGAANSSGGWDFETGPFTLHADGHWKLASTAGADASHTTERHAVTYTTCEDRTEPLPGDDPRGCEGPPEVSAYPDGTAVVVEWEHHQDPNDTAHYDVRRSEAGERDFTSIAQADPERTTYRDASVEPGTEYVYTVAARDEETGREGRPCDHARAFASDEGAPPCPESLSAEPREDETIALDWKAVEGADTYKVYRSTPDTEFYQIATVQEAEHVDPDSEDGTTYKYRVTAANEAGEGRNCPAIETTAIPAFPTLALVAVGATAGATAYATVRRWR